MAEAKFVIGGRDYPIPAIETFTLDEAMVLYHYSKLTLDQVSDLEGLHPGMVAALMHVGLARDNPEAKFKAIEKLVKDSNLFEILGKMEAETEEQDDAADPPVPPLEPPATEPAPEPSGDDGLSDGESPLVSPALRAIGQAG